MLLSYRERQITYTFELCEQVSLSGRLLSIGLLSSVVFYSMAEASPHNSPQASVAGPTGPTFPRCTYVIAVVVVLLSALFYRVYYQILMMDVPLESMPETIQGSNVSAAVKYNMPSDSVFSVVRLALRRV